MVLRDNRAPSRSGTFDEGHPIPARRTWGGSRGPQRPVKLHLRPGAKKPLVSSHPSSLAQVYHFIFILYRPPPWTIAFLLAQGSAHNRLCRMRPGAYYRLGLAYLTALQKQHGMLQDFVWSCFAPGGWHIIGAAVCALGPTGLGLHPELLHC